MTLEVDATEEDVRDLPSALSQRKGRVGGALLGVVVLGSYLFPYQREPPVGVNNLLLYRKVDRGVSSGVVYIISKKIPIVM